MGHVWLIHDHFVKVDVYVSPPVICLCSGTLHSDMFLWHFCYLNNLKHTIKVDIIKLPGI